MELINMFVTAGTLLILFQMIHLSTQQNCNDHKDCRTCTSHKTWTSIWTGTNDPCPWCPLTQQCHAKGSLWNHCSSSENIVNVSKCDGNEVEKYTYNATEAYKLALFSAAAYSDKPGMCLQTLFPNSDYNIVSILNRSCDDYIFDYEKHCKAFVTSSQRNKEVIVAFRGTIGIKQLIDQVLSTIAIPSVSSAVGGRVQSYFNNVHKRFYGSLKKLIKNLKSSYPDYQFKVTGHSLGGTTASITSAMLVKDNILKPEDISLYTFGMPRVGNKQYALAHDSLVPDSWRVVRKGDIVARLPTCTLLSCSLFNGPYHHGNKVIYSGATMTKNSTYAVCDGNEDSLSECTKIERQEAAANLKRKKRGAFDLEKHTYEFGIQLGPSCQSMKRK